MRRTYFDHSATTPVDGEVAKLMLEYMTDKFGNPSSIHHFGLEAKKAVEEARGKVAELIGAGADEIYFTSGEKAITDQTILITIMFANNEVGTIQPVSEIQPVPLLRPDIIEGGKQDAVFGQSYGSLYKSPQRGGDTGCRWYRRGRQSQLRRYYEDLFKS